MNLQPIAVSMSDHRIAALRLAQGGLVGVITVSVAVSLWLWWDSGTATLLAEEAARGTRRLTDANQDFVKEAERQGVIISESRATRVRQDITFLQDLTARSRFSWTAFLGHLEDAVPADISIGSIALEQKEGAIKLKGAAADLTALGAFAGALERHAAFEQAMVTEHHAPHKTASNPDAGTAVDFQLTVIYRALPGMR